MIIDVSFERILIVSTGYFHPDEYVVTHEMDQMYILCLISNEIDNEKVQVCSHQEKAQSKEIPTPKTKMGKTKYTIRYLYLENIS